MQVGVEKQVLFRRVTRRGASALITELSSRALACLARNKLFIKRLFPFAVMLVTDFICEFVYPYNKPEISRDKSA